MVGVWGAGVRVGLSFMDAERGELLGALGALEERAMAGDLIVCRGAVVRGMPGAGGACGS